MRETDSVGTVIRYQAVTAEDEATALREFVNRFPGNYAIGTLTAMLEAQYELTVGSRHYRFSDENGETLRDSEVFTSV